LPCGIGYVWECPLENEKVQSNDLEERVRRKMNNIERELGNTERQDLKSRGCFDSSLAT
jgi:hypothetical protein